MRRAGIVFIAVIAVASALQAAAPTTSASGYKLVWHDESNNDGPLDEKDWSYENGFVRNAELQWYQPQNATCAGGFLIIEAKRESKPNPNYAAGTRNWPTSQPTIEYTSASVNTLRKHSWLYGRFEIRARIDTRVGSWPAFWTMGTSGYWPACGEVDIMEFYRSMLLANVAWAQKGGTNRSMWNTSRKLISEFPKDWSDQFHTWRMDWDENSIKLYCDDQLLNAQDLTKTVNPDGTNPFHHPAYFLLNQAIGSQGGDPSKTAFPVRFVIDDVRVYQR